jgi:hypothetical protein
MRRDRMHTRSKGEAPTSDFDARNLRVGGSFVRDVAAPGLGEPLSPATRKQLEAGLGHSFADLRVHADADADQLARRIDAGAFTLGNHVYFREHQYRPNTESGFRVLAHEATHVAQQSSAGARELDAEETLAIGEPNGSFELEASQAADAVLAGERVAVSSDVGQLGGSAPVVQRFGWDTLFGGSEGSEDEKDDVGVLQGVMSLVGTVADTAEGLAGEIPYVGDIADIGAAAGNFIEAQVGGQDLGESLATTAGQYGAGKLADYVSTPEDTLINAVHSIASIAGLDESVTDFTEVASDMTPTSFLGDIGGNLSRGLMNLVTDDDEAQDRHAKDLVEGDGGAPLQGYALAYDFVDRLVSGEDPEEALMDVGSQGQDSPLARMGNYLGDTAYEFINEDLAEAGEIAGSEEGLGVMEFLGVGEDEGTTTLWDHIGSDVGDLFDF